MGADTREGTTLRRVRAFTRLAALAVAAVLAAAILPWPWAPMVPAAASPFVMIASVLALRAAGIVALIGFPVLVLVLRRPRWFCRWACPVGLVEESLGRMRPSGATQFVKWPPVGQWIALVTLGGAAAGYPLLVWLDPLAMLSGLVGAWRWPLTFASVTAAVGLPVVLVFSVIFPHAWCGRVCPLGAMQDLLAWPRQWLRRRAADNSDVGTVAAATVGTHPQPSPRLDKPAVPHPPGGLPRRVLLAAGLGGVCGVAVRAACGGGTPALRPPGAIDESRFTGVCVRCGNCVRACPARIIRPDLGGHGLAGLLAPEVTFADDFCREDCRACTEVCPSGAISRLPMDEKRRFVIGLARVDLTICILSKGEECTVCTRACSYDAISTPRSADGDTMEPRVDLARCVGCGACEVMCPTETAKAIRVYPAAPSNAGRALFSPR